MTPPDQTLPREKVERSTILGHLSVLLGIPGHLWNPSIYSLSVESSFRGFCGVHGLVGSPRNKEGRNQWSLVQLSSACLRRDLWSVCIVER